jgi:hypothetical protein
MGLALVVVLGGWLLRANPADVGAPFVPLLFLQMFASSSEFSGPASRGYFDALLVSGWSRPAVAASHWVAAVLPGVTAWAALGLLELAMADPQQAIGFEPRSLVALLLVSTIPWALTLPLPRFSGGLLWTVLMLVLTLTRSGSTFLRNAVAVTEGAPAGDMATVAAALAACPLLFLNPSATSASASAFVLVTEAALAVLVFAGGVAYVTRREYPLA